MAIELVVFELLVWDNNYEERSIYRFEGGQEVAADAADHPIHQRIR